MTYRPISSLLERFERITEATAVDNAQDHRALLQARKILLPWQHLESLPHYRPSVDEAVRKALAVYGKPPYLEFFGGLEVAK